MPKRSPKPPAKADATFQLLLALSKEIVARLDAIALEMSLPRVALLRWIVEAFLAERDKGKLSVELSDDLRRDLIALSEAMDGAPLQGMTVNALRRYIKYRTEGNDEINERYQELRAHHATNRKVLPFPRARSRTK